MSNVVLIPSPSVSASHWKPAIDKGFDLLNIHSLEEIRVLADACPLTESWVTDPVRQNSGVIFKAISTNWEPVDGNTGREVGIRNEALLTGADFVIALGSVVTSSAAHVLAKAFSNPKLHVAQVIGDVAEIVGKMTIKVADVKRRDELLKILHAEPKPNAPREAESWSKYMAKGPKSKKS